MRSKCLWKFKFFWDDAKNAKNDANVLKKVFFGFSMFFAIFGFFLKIYQNMGQKLGSNNTDYEFLHTGIFNFVLFI